MQILFNTGPKNVLKIIHDQLKNNEQWMLRNIDKEYANEWLKLISNSLKDINE